LVRTVEITAANNNQVKVENMPNGAYFVTGMLNGEVVTKKVIVIR
jgi:aspartate 1-decarboxylase